MPMVSSSIPHSLALIPEQAKQPAIMVSRIARIKVEISQVFSLSGSSIACWATWRLKRQSRRYIMRTGLVRCVPLKSCASREHYDMLRRYPTGRPVAESRQRIKLMKHLLSGAAIAARSRLPAHGRERNGHPTCGSVLGVQHVSATPSEHRHARAYHLRPQQHGHAPPYGSIEPEEWPTS